MTLAATDDHLLRITAGVSDCAQPRLRQLPEQRAFATILADDFGSDQQPAEQCFGGGFIEMPGQALAGRVTGKQPITGRPDGLTVGMAEALLYLHMQLGLASQAQLDQRLPFKAEAQAAFGFISYKTAACRQGQGSQVIQIGHGSGSR